MSKANKYARKRLLTRSEATAIEKGKAAYLEIYANLHLLDGSAATELRKPTTGSEAPSFKSLDGVDRLEQYEHLSQLLHIQKTVRDKR